MSALYRTLTLVLIGSLLIGACGSAEPTVTPVPTTATPSAPSATRIPPAKTPVPTDTPVPPTDTPKPTATAVPVKRLIEWADLGAGKGPVYSQAWSPDGLWLVTTDTEQVRVWDMTSRREAGVLEGHTNFVWGLAWSPDGSTLASASQDGTVRLWDVPAYTTAAVLETGGAYCLAWSPDGRQLAVGNDAGDVQRWDVAAQEVLETWSSEANDNRDDIISIAWSPDGQTVAFGDLAGGIYLWDVATSQARLVLTEQNPSDRGHDVNGLAWSPDGSTLASTHPDGQLQLWDGATGQMVRAIAAHSGWAGGVAWSPDGRLLASTGEDKRICLWNPETGQEYAEQHHNTLGVWSVSWSPDGAKVASGGGAYEQPHVGATIVWQVPPLVTPEPTATGSNVRQVTNTPAGATAINPVWRPERSLSISAAALTATVPAGAPVALDGLFSPGEWDRGLRQEFTDGGELILMQDGRYLYLGIHENFDGLAVTSVLLEFGEQISVLHSSGSLGAAIFKRGDDGWQLTQAFAWELYNVTSHSAGDEKKRQDFLAAKGWLANLGSMTETEEIEYQIAIPNGPFRIAVAYLRPPNMSRAAWWPADLADDCLNIDLLQGNVAEDLNAPLLLQFAPETWATFSPSPEEE